jgi:hypothetical protein
MEPLEVTARFDVDGNVTPLSFTWKSSKYTVESTGRHWRDESGMHILIMAMGERVFELLFIPENTFWKIKPVAAPRSVI